MAVEGNELTEVGLTLQLPVPKVDGQLTETVPLKPSWEAIEIGPFVPVLPRLTSGNADGSEIVNVGFDVTETLKAAVIGAGTPVDVA
jgi:hypothetical protein